MAAAAASTEWADESEYERQRRENIAANARLLLSLGLDTAGLGLVHGHSFLHPPLSILSARHCCYVFLTLHTIETGYHDVKRWPTLDLTRLGFWCGGWLQCSVDTASSWFEGAFAAKGSESGTREAASSSSSGSVALSKIVPSRGRRPRELQRESDRCRCERLPPVFTPTLAVV